MSISETNDQFYKNLIEHYKSIGDTENARINEDFYKGLKALSKSLDEDNRRVIDELTKKGKFKKD